MQDTGHILVDNHGCGTEARAKLEEEIRLGTRSFREVSEDMWASLHVPFDDGFIVMEKTIEMDSGFREFHQYCVANGFPFNVISAGLKPVLRRVLDTYLGAEQVRTTYTMLNELGKRNNHANIETSHHQLTSSQTTQSSSPTAQNGSLSGATTQT